MLWKYALMDCEPRPISVKPKNICVILPGKEHQAKGYCNVPPTLQVCRLARTEALRRYVLTFQKNLVHPVYFDRRKNYLVVEDFNVWENFVDHGLTHEESVDSFIRQTTIHDSNDWTDIEFLSMERTGRFYWNAIIGWVQL